MSGILSYGVVFPEFEIEDAVLDPTAGRKGKKHVVAYCDEDVVTLAFAAAGKCLSNYVANHMAEALESVDAVMFATSTPILEGRYHATLLAGLLGLRDGIFALDFCSGTRSGTDALMLADLLLGSGKYSNVLVVASDMKVPKVGDEIGSPFGHSVGHSGCAFLLGRASGIAEIVSSQSFGSAVLGLSEASTYGDSEIEPDGRFWRERVFNANFALAVQRVQNRLPRMDAVLASTDTAKLGAGILSKAGFNVTERLVKDTVTPEAGFTGAAHALILIARRLDDQAAGNFLVFDYANGTNVIEFSSLASLASSGIRNGVSPDISAVRDRTQVKSYKDYLTLRRPGGPCESFSSEMMQEREKPGMIHLDAHECAGCGSAYLLKAARCKRCGGVTFSGKKLGKTGTIYSFTKEHYFPHPFGPVCMAVIDLDGGGRMTVQLTDDMYADAKGKIQIGAKATLVLRKMMPGESKPNYFWKCKVV